MNKAIKISPYFNGESDTKEKKEEQKTISDDVRIRDCFLLLFKAIPK